MQGVNSRVVILSVVISHEIIYVVKNPVSGSIQSSRPVMGYKRLQFPSVLVAGQVSHQIMPVLLYILLFWFG